MNAATREILTNPEILSVHQDPLGKQAARVLQDGDREVWKKPRKGGALAIALLNRGDGPKTIRARWKDLGITGKRRVRDLWQRTELGVLTDFVELEVSRHGTVALHVA